MATTIEDITRLSNDAARGSSTAAEQLWNIVNQDIRPQAVMLAAREQAAADIQPTMLINEAWIRLNQGERPPTFTNRREFYGAIWRLMRQILVDYARARKSLKRGGDRQRVDLDFAANGLEQLDTLGDETDRLLPALDELRELDPEGFDVFWGRFALGMTKQQVASMLDIKVSEVDANWQHAKAWLRANLDQASDDKQE